MRDMNYSQANAALIENLRKYKTMAELRQSAFFVNCHGQIESLLKTPQLYFCPDTKPGMGAFLRIAQWNIEKGKHFDAVLERLRTDEILRWADVIVLNEADCGMIRSQNRHVAKALAQELGMHMVFAPAHFELTKGTADELNLEGENSESLQGNAILSRYPVLETCVVPLPATFEAYECHEKRFGRRNCLWARIRLQRSSLWVGSVHLELRNTPQCRARQMRYVMEHLPGGGSGAYILGGDLNTNTFGRGTAWRTMKSVVRLVFGPSWKVKKTLLCPERGSEPLFNVLRRYGFAWEGFNSNEETARSPIDSLEEALVLPKFLLRLIKARLDPYKGFLCFKLDWIVGKNLLPLGRAERIDIDTGKASLVASRVDGDNSSTVRASDHLPIYADLDLA